MTTPSSAACTFELLHIYYVGVSRDSDVLVSMVQSSPQLVRIVKSCPFCKDGSCACTSTPVLTSEGMKILVELLATYERLTKC
jgi:hypothetical protein